MLVQLWDLSSGETRNRNDINDVSVANVNVDRDRVVLCRVDEAEEAMSRELEQTTRNLFPFFAVDRV